MAQGFNTLQKTLGLTLMGCALLIIPLSAGIVILTQFNNSGKQISAAPLAATSNKCDFNHDGKVDSADVDMAAAGFGKVDPAKNNEQYDVVANGWVNSGDLSAISANSPQYCIPVAVYSPTPTGRGPIAGCSIVPNQSIKPGGPIFINHSGFAEGESVALRGNSIGNPNIGTTKESRNAPANQSFQLPQMPSGTYAIFIKTRFPIVEFDCGQFNIQPVWNSTPSPKPTSIKFPPNYPKP